MIIETMVVHYMSAGDIYERLLPAIRSARESINGLRSTACRGLLKAGDAVLLPLRD